MDILIVVFAAIQYILKHLLCSLGEPKWGDSVGLLDLLTDPPEYHILVFGTTLLA